jgi:outer membrane lipoprotein-sorting protein
MKNKFALFLLITVAALQTSVSAAIAEDSLYADSMQNKVNIYQQDMARIESALNAITTMVSSFSQVASNGEASSGTFYLSRPGKLRWEYIEPSPIRIITKGKMLVYYDVELDQVSHVSIDDVLASFLTRETIRFNDEDILVTGFTKDAAEIAVTIVSKEKPEESSLTMAFGSTSYELQRLEVVDATQKRTQIFFESSVMGVPIDEKFFTLPKFTGSRN